MGLRRVRQLLGQSNDNDHDADDQGHAQVLYILTPTEDGGADQKSGRLIMYSVLDTYDWIWMFDIDCLAHKYHLVVGGGLAWMDHAVKRMKRHLKGECSYFSSWAKIGHTWRNNSTKMMEYFNNNWPDNIGSSRLPPPAIPGRWGSVDAFEHFMKQVGIRKAARAMHVVVGKVYDDDGNPDVAASVEALGSQLPASSANSQQQTSTASVPASKPTDEIALDENKQYSEKIGKYSRASLKSIKEPIMWFMLEISHYARIPLQSFYHWSMKHGDRPFAIVDLASCTQLVSLRFVCFG